MKLILVGLAFAVVAGTLSYTFLSVSVAEIASISVAAARTFVSGFLVVYALTSVLFFILLFVVGVQLSHRIIGPIKSFEGYINSLVAGEKRQFKLRKTDEFKELEGIADQFLKIFSDDNGIAMTPLAAGSDSPSFAAMSYDGILHDSAEFKGRKVWLMFYRYATCPLCILYLSEIRELLERAKARNVIILAVFESNPRQFLKQECGSTSELLLSLKIPLISDPERMLYRKFKTQQSLFALMHWRSFVNIFRARRKNFRQASVDGVLGQLPAHFLIDETGTLHTAFYGKTLTDHIDAEEVRKFIG